MPLTIVLTLFGCFIPLVLMLLPAVGIWGELGYMENTGICIKFITNAVLLKISSYTIILSRDLHDNKLQWGTDILLLLPVLCAQPALPGDRVLLLQHPRHLQEGPAQDGQSQVLSHQPKQGAHKLSVKGELLNNF